MENLEINKILNREENYHIVKNALLSFEKNKHDAFSKKGIYIYQIKVSLNGVTYQEAKQLLLF